MFPLIVSLFFVAVDDLEQCSAIVGTDDKGIFASNKGHNISRSFPLKREGDKPRRYFPFKQGYLSIATIRMGIEGIQVTVDGKHISSFAYREVLLLQQIHFFFSFFL